LALRGNFEQMKVLFFASRVWRRGCKFLKWQELENYLLVYLHLVISELNYVFPE